MVAGGEEIVKDFGKVMYTLLFLKWITNKNLLYSTWNFAQHYVPAWIGEGFWSPGGPHRVLLGFTTTA